MKKFLTTVALLLIISISVYLEISPLNEIKLCEPIDHTNKMLCDMNNIPITDSFKIYHENGNLRVEGNYIDGKPEGLAKAYHENGNLKTEANFKDGKREGVVKTYHENGNLRSEENFKDGEPVSGYLYDIDGKQKK